MAVVSPLHRHHFHFGWIDVGDIVQSLALETKYLECFTLGTPRTATSVIRTVDVAGYFFGVVTV
jgi:hypothetical protein